MIPHHSSGPDKTSCPDSLRESARSGPGLFPGQNTGISDRTTDSLYYAPYCYQ